MSESPAHPLKSYKVPFDSVEPAIPTGSDVIGDSSYYSTHRPERWDIVAFSAPGSKPNANAGRFVKRIVGLPGETIQLTNKGLVINESLVPVPPALKGRFSSFGRHEDYKYGTKAYKIPADSVFMMGDNSEVYVSDSRKFVPVP